MRTEKQIQASRANGARSKGPITAEGKQTSSRNSTFHGLLADTVVLNSESKEAFLEMLQTFLDEHNPVNATETALVEKMVIARWQQFRILGIQKACLDQDMSTDPASIAAAKAIATFRNPDGSSPMQLLLRYDIAADRQFHRALARLQDLQSNSSAIRTHQPVPQPNMEQHAGLVPRIAPSVRVGLPPVLAIPNVGRTPGLQPNPSSASFPPISKVGRTPGPQPQPPAKAPSSPPRKKPAA